MRPRATRGYVWLNNSIYGELGLYRSAPQGFNVNGLSGPLDSTAGGVVKGATPYWRIATERQWEKHSLSVGAYGTRTKISAVDQPLTDTFRDIAVDGQYQFIGDPHIVSVQTTYIREHQSLDARFALGEAANLRNDLHTTRLAGQRKEYLEAQLKAFRDRSRADPMAQAYMWGMTSQLTDDTIAKLAAYYAEQKPVSGKGSDPKLIQAGLTLFEQGMPAANVPACGTCHGKNAEGNTVIPRLAGQHAEYLLKQLVMFKSELRSGASAPIMHSVTTSLTFDQMHAVAAYLMSR